MTSRDLAAILYRIFKMYCIWYENWLKNLKIDPECGMVEDTKK
jgi:hypothetical protein